MKQSSNQFAVVSTILFVAVVLSGCLGSDDEVQTDDQDPDLMPEKGLGTVTGSILTIHLEPVSNAQVSLVKNDDVVADSVTDPEGAFTIQNIEPGEYRLQVSAVCCRGNVRAVNVVADEITDVGLQLEPWSDRDLDRPFVEHHEWNGFLACGVGLLVTAASLCSWDANDENFIQWMLPEGVEAIVVGLEWQSPGSPFGERLSISLVEICQDGVGDHSTCYTHAGEAGGSPLVFTVESPEGEWSFANAEDEREFMFRVFPANDPGVFWQQSFSLYYHLFINHMPDEGYNPIPDA